MKIVYKLVILEKKTLNKIICDSDKTFYEHFLIHHTFIFINIKKTI